MRKPRSSRGEILASDGGASSGGVAARGCGSAIGLIERFAARLADGRASDRVVHDVSTLVGQRVPGVIYSAVR